MVVFFHPIPLVLFPSCYKLIEWCWVSAGGGMEGCGTKTAFPWRKMCWGRKERPSFLSGFYFSVSGLDVAPAGRGRDQCWVCWSCFLQCQPKSRGFSQKKKAPSASHPPTCCSSRDWEKGRIFQPVLSFPHPRPDVPLGFLSLAPSARWFFLLGSAGLLGDGAFGENVLTFVEIFRVESEVQVHFAPFPPSLGLWPRSHREILWDLGKTNGFLELCALHQAQGKLELWLFLRNLLLLLCLEMHSVFVAASHLIFGVNQTQLKPNNI